MLLCSIPSFQKKKKERKKQTNGFMLTGGDDRTGNWGEEKSFSASPLCRYICLK